MSIVATHTTDGIVITSGATVYNAEGEAYTFVAMYDDKYLCKPIVISYDEDGEEWEYKVNQIVPLTDVWSNPPFRKMHENATSLKAYERQLEASCDEAKRQLHIVHQDVEAAREKYREVMTFALQAQDIVRREKLTKEQIALLERELLTGTGSKHVFYRAAVRFEPLWQVHIVPSNDNDYGIRRIQVNSVCPREGAYICGKLVFSTDERAHKFVPSGTCFSTEEEALTYANQRLAEYVADIEAKKVPAWAAIKHAVELTDSIRALGLPVPEILLTYRQQKISELRRFHTIQLNHHQAELNSLKE